MPVSTLQRKELPKVSMARRRGGLLLCKESVTHQRVRGGPTVLIRKWRITAVSPQAAVEARDVRGSREARKGLGVVENSRMTTGVCVQSVRKGKQYTSGARE